MTEARANEIFRTKYPEGEIVRRHASSAGNKFFVVFKKNGKVYEYACSTYQQLLGRFGFSVVYQHDIDSMKHRIANCEKTLEDLNNGIMPPFFNCFNLMSDEEALETEIKDTQKELDELKENLKHALEDCIIDNI